MGQNGVLVNGTIESRGLGASPDHVSLVESNSSGNLVFVARFPRDTGLFLSRSYSVSINIYFPQTIRFSSFQVDNANGEVDITNLNASTAKVSTVNGGLRLSCVYCGSVTGSTTNGGILSRFDTISSNGSYTLTTVNGSIDLTLPTSGSFRFTANTVNGNISPPVRSMSQVEQTATHFSGIAGSGSATIILTTTNGAIQITG